MVHGSDIKKQVERKPLKDFTRLIIAFFGCLIVLSIYQNVRLYIGGVLDSIINKSFFLLLVHHLGFTAITALPLAFLFNFLENKRGRSGFRLMMIILMLLLIIETLLVEYYVRNYEVLSLGLYSLNGTSADIRYAINTILFTLLIGGILFTYLYKATVSLYTVISKMYPFTIVLFGLFLATLTSNRRPINENKLQHLVSAVAIDLVDFNKYEGTKEYPLLKQSKYVDVLGQYFNLPKEKPNIVVLVVDGLGADFVNKKGIFKGFAPFISQLSKESLYWNNYLSNGGETQIAIPSIMGSLPFGKEGFMHVEEQPNRHTLYSILKHNGYTTSFNFGGNTALDHLDKFLDDDRVDQILDNKGFGTGYTLQAEDAAGISLGYPDDQLFKKWNTLQNFDNKPKLEVFLTLSTKRPFQIPEKEQYKKKVSELLSTTYKDDRNKKLIENNIDLFASILYTDQALKSFFEAYKRKETFNNTIFILTGSHHITELPKENEIDRYRVPLLIYSPLLKAPKNIGSLASHADITPSLIALLKNNYQLKTPLKDAWIGNSLVSPSVFHENKEIPLFRDKNNIKNYIYGSYFLSGRSVYQLGNDLTLEDIDDSAPTDLLLEKFSYFKSVNSHVTLFNKIIPEQDLVFRKAEAEFKREEVIWVNSVFNGKDFDNAYKTARKLAINEERKRALLLCRYILTKIPGHADTEILMGRIYAWEKEYSKSIAVLKTALRKYPSYADGYAALLDVYYWSDRNEEAITLFKSIEQHRIDVPSVNEKLARAYKKLKLKAAKDSTSSFIHHPKLETIVALSLQE